MTNPSFLWAPASFDGSLSRKYFSEPGDFSPKWEDQKIKSVVKFTQLWQSHVDLSLPSFRSNSFLSHLSLLWFTGFESRWMLQNFLYRSTLKVSMSGTVTHWLKRERNFFLLFLKERNIQTCLLYMKLWDAWMPHGFITPVSYHH